MKKNSTIVLSIIGALAVIVGAINPTMQVYAQNSVTADQSNAVTVDISQSASQSAQPGEETSELTGEDGVDQSIEQGFCFSINQQNAAAGNTAANEGSNEINCP